MFKALLIEMVRREAIGRDDVSIVESVFGHLLDLSGYPIDHLS